MNNTFLEYALIECSKIGTHELVQMLIDNGADINCRDENDKTPLLLACENNHYEVVQILLKNNADTSASYGRAVKELMNGITKKYPVHLVMKLTKNYLDNSPKERSNPYESDGTADASDAIVFAVKNNNIDILTALVAKQFNLNPTNTLVLNESLMHSFQFWRKSKNFVLIEELLEKGADINYINKKQETPFSSSLCNYEGYALINFLICKGVNFDEIDKNGQTPLYKMLYEDLRKYQTEDQTDERFKTAKLLINAGADLHKGSTNRTPYTLIKHFKLEKELNLIF